MISKNGITIDEIHLLTLLVMAENVVDSHGLTQFRSISRNEIPINVSHNVLYDNGIFHSFNGLQHIA